MIQDRTNLLPQDIKLYLKNLCRILLGLFLFLLSITLLLSLFTHNATDISLNTASTFATKNLFHKFGSCISDILLQFFGLSSITIVYVTYLTSKWLINNQSLNHSLKKISLYAIISIIPTTLALSYLSTNISLFAHYPSYSGFGGIIGLSIQSEVSTLLHNLGISPYMHSIIFILTILASIITNYFAYNLTPSSIAKFENFVSKIYTIIIKTTLRILGKKLHGGNMAQLPKEKKQSIIINFIKKLFSHKNGSISNSEIRNARSNHTSMKSNVNKDTTQKVKKATPSYRLPTTDLLNKVKSTNYENINSDSNIKKARMLENILREYKLDGKITNIKTGPVITLFEMEPGPGIRTSDIKRLSEDIARKIEATSTRIAVIPGTNKIGIELPNLHRQIVSLRDQFECPDFEHSEYKLPISLGSDTNGHPTFVDLATMPHLLIAGTTGSGKSVGVNDMILSLLYKYAPDECKFIMIDPKMVEFSVYNDIPHLLTPVVIDPAKAVAALKWAVLEMEDRYQNMHIVGSKNIESYNEKARNNPGRKITRPVQTGFDPQTGEPLIDEKEIEVKPYPYIVVVVDEMADLMLQAKKEVETAIARLAAKARAAGIHLILSTQRPSVDVITGTIKSNFPNRISYHVASGQDSRTILNEYGAELLLGKGDMLYMGTGGGTVRIHGAFVSEQEIENVVRFIKNQSKPNYIQNITVEDETPQKNAMSAVDRAALKEAKGEDLYAQAVEIILSTKRPSISFLQRQLGIGYNKSANLIERMERDGILSAPDSTGKRMIIGKK